MELKALAEPTPETAEKIRRLRKQFVDYLANRDDEDYEFDGELVVDAPESARKAQEEWKRLLRRTM